MRRTEDSGVVPFFFGACTSMRGLSLGERQTIERLGRRKNDEITRECVCGESDYIL